MYHFKHRSICAKHRTKFSSGLLIFDHEKAAIDSQPNVDIKRVKCADDLSESPRAEQGQGTKAGRVCDGNYSSLTFQGPRPTVF